MTVTPFYVMESKVWARLYQRNAENLTVRAQPVGAGDDAPVMNVPARDAVDFAARVFKGRLPSPAEWDEAAGLFDIPPHPSLTQANGKPRVKILIPGPTHGENRGTDVNHNDLIDMAGNGTEWTRGVVSGETKPGANPMIEERAQFNPGDLVVLRGRRYTLTDPLTYERLGYEQKVPQTQLADKPNEFTGFRVVVPLP
jgi:formylglycine-generating enzyme required for sulfatase activity